MTEFGIESIHIFTLLIIGISFLASLGIWFHRRVDKIEKRSWRTERALILFVQIMVKEKKRLHKDDGEFDEIEKMVNTILIENENDAVKFSRI